MFCFSQFKSATEVASPPRKLTSFYPSLAEQDQHSAPFGAPFTSSDAATENGSEDLPEVAHLVGIVCTRNEYYTIPDLKDLKLDENGECWIQGFTVGRKGHGKVVWPGEVNVAGLNLDEIGELPVWGMVVKGSSGGTEGVEKGNPLYADSRRGRRRRREI